MSAPDEPAAEVPDLRLRGDPPRIVRLSRRALAFLAAGTTAVVGGALLYALQPNAPHKPDELYSGDAKPTSDALAGMPKDYGEVPKLGPPLPGDLGRPILSAQQRGVPVEPPPIGAAPPPSASESPTVNAAQAAREHVRQERDAARLSKLFLGDPAPAAAAPASATPTGMPAAGSLAQATPTVAAPAADSGGQASKRAFLRADAGMPGESTDRVTAPTSPYVLEAGSVIPAALITGIRSDLPGQVTAQVTENVYDSPTGKLLLIPQGSKLVGEYDSQVSFDQDRALLAWDRLILPDGRSIALDRQPGTDGAGFAGLQDRVDYHWGGMLRASLVSTLLSIGAEAGNTGDSALVKALRQGTSDSASQLGQEIVRRQLNVAPTITIRPGFLLRVLVTRDLILAPGGGAQ